jgi:hypothetical protein
LLRDKTKEVIATMMERTKLPSWWYYLLLLLLQFASLLKVCFLDHFLCVLVSVKFLVSVEFSADDYFLYFLTSRSMGWWSLEV